LSFLNAKMLVLVLPTSTRALRSCATAAAGFDPANLASSLTFSASSAEGVASAARSSFEVPADKPLAISGVARTAATAHSVTMMLAASTMPAATLIRLVLIIISLPAG
jgi:hypothetical protein